MMIDLKKDLDRLKDTLTRQTKTKGEHAPSEENLSVKKETLKNIQKIIKNLEESEYMVQDAEKNPETKRLGKNLRFGNFSREFLNWFLTSHTSDPDSLERKHHGFGGNISR